MKQKKRKNRIITLSLREIKKSFKRFFSLAILSLLGVSFFVGLSSASKSFKTSANKYIRDTNGYDLKVVSSLGLNDKDLENIRKVNNNFKVYGSKTKDAVIDRGNLSFVVRVEEISNEYNKIVIKEGREPQNKNEMLMEYGLNQHQDINIGDKIVLDGETIEIVGSALSTDHLIKSELVDNRGTSKVGTGRVDFYFFAQKEYFDFDYYTQAYIVDEGLLNDSIITEEYKEGIRKDKEILNDVKDELEEKKYNGIIEEATQKIDEEEKEANEKLDEAKSKLDNAKLELDNAKEELEQSKKTLNSAKIEIDDAEQQISEYDKQLETAKKELDKAKQELDKNKSVIDASKKEIDDAQAQIDSGEQELNNSKAQVDDLKDLFEANLTEYGYTYDFVLNFYNQCMEQFKSVEKTIEVLSPSLDEETLQKLQLALTVVDQIESGYKQVEEGRLELESQKAKLEEGKKEYNSGFSKYEEALNKYNEGYNEYIKNKNELDSKKNALEEAKNEYNSGLKKYNNGLYEYNNGLSTYNKNLEEYENSKKEAEEKIKDARNELKNIEEASFFITDRNDNYEYCTYMSLCNSFGNIATTFPVIFLVVAVFVSLLSMARMAIENRSEIGLLKALGFSNKEIRVKYVLYALLATLIGGVIGAFLGNNYLSYMCYIIFSHLYQVPVFENANDIIGMILGIVFAVVAIVGATLMVIKDTLKRDATELLRPIAPKPGKKILLEKVEPIWKRLDFSNRIMARNIFRYKRRVIMSLIGFIGCTSLIIAGYAIRDSMIHIIDKQFIEISDYDQIANLDGKLSKEEIDELLNYNKITRKAYAKISIVEAQDSRATFIIPNDIEEFRTIFNIKDYKTGETLELKDNEVVITKKLAENLNLKVGDEIEFIDSNILRSFKISALAENYVDNYIYLNKETYSNSVDKYTINCAFIKFDSLEGNEEFITNLTENEHLLNTVSSETTINSFSSMLNVFHEIIKLLVIFSALLSFVVMFSLSYITISERQREIATLKVLGYYNKDVDKYILKEQLVITLIGIFSGVSLGSLYSNILVKSINFGQLYLVKQIEIMSYFKTIGFILAFAFITSIEVHFALKKISLIDSLKRIE